MKAALAILVATVLVACSSKDHCASTATIAAFGQEEARKSFPVPGSVSYTLDSVYSHNGNEVVRGRVTYTNALGLSRGPSKYWIAVKCDDGKAKVKFIDVDDGGPKMTMPE